MPINLPVRFLPEAGLTHVNRVRPVAETRRASDDLPGVGRHLAGHTIVSLRH